MVRCRDPQTGGQQNWILCFIFCFLVHEAVATLELSLDGRDGGFFLRTSESSQDEGEDRFTLLQSQSPVTVRSQFGPFVVKQTVLPFSNRYSNGAHANNSGSTSDLGFESLLPANDVDVSAHIVTREVRRDRPVLRVLFHTSRSTESKLRKTGPNRDDTNKGVHNKNGVEDLCVVLYIRSHGQHLMAACSPGSNRDGVCLAEATLPSSWWPPLESPAWKSVKTQRTWVRVEYAAIQSLGLECSDSSLPVSAPPGLPGIFLAEIPLAGASGSYEEVKSDDVVRILVPQAPVYPKSKVYVPVYLQPNPAYPPYVFVIRAKVKNGMKILGAQVSHQPSQWSITVALNPRQTVATVTAFIKDTSTEAPVEHEDTITRIQEVFTWLFEIDEDATYNAEGGSSGRIQWQLRYMLDSSLAEQYDFDEDNVRISSRLDIRKDDVQAIIPIAKSEKLLNTAVLNGRQVSQPMRVFVISQAGKVGDITLQSSCHAADESILKVSPSCTSVYLDGSEIRGSQNASVLVKYGTYTGQAHFLVWMPELPLVVRVSDTKLSQVKGWKTPQLQRRKVIPTLSGISSNGQQNPTRSQTDRWSDRENMDIVCRLRFQQSRVEVYTRFFSVDHNSGRESYLLSRREELRVTELVSPFLRVADGRIASLLKGNIIQGLQSGRTEVQVLSPITGRVIGAKEFRVGTEKETITHLRVAVITGLQLNVVQDENMPEVFIAQKSVSHKLTTQYQEGLLDIQLHFSDGTATSITDISDTDYRLSVDTFDSGIVAFAPMAGLHHPRVIAIGQGKGEYLHITLELADRCQKRRSQPLSMAYAYIDVDFSKDRVLQNDARPKNKGILGNKAGSEHVPSFSEAGGTAIAVNRDINSILYQDSVSPRSRSHYEPAVQARQNLVHPADLTPLEIGMYALLGVFCIAILVFLVSCSVFAVRHRRKQIPPVVTNDTVAHAHDWVWLGRATLERNSVNTKCSQTLLPMADFNGNHTTVSAGTSKVQRREKKPDGRQIGSGCRGSNLSFPGSEVSIRITTNPQELQEDETSLIEKNTFTGLSNIPNPPFPDSGSATITRPEKRVRIVTNPVPPPLPPQANQLKHIPPYPVPPVPPHRNHPAPPVPPHHRHLLGRLPRGVQTDAEWEAATQGMDYDQLVEYFENLKESNA